MIYKEIEYLIMGGGPAGIQMGYFMERDCLDYIVLEKTDSAGAFFKYFPRHGTLISINKVYTGKHDKEVNMRWDWNSLLSDNFEKLFKEYSTEYFPPATALVRYLNDFVHHFNIRIKYNSEVVQIEKAKADDKWPDGYRVTLANHQTYHCSVLLAAPGLTKPYIPPIVGIEHAVNYADMNLDRFAYANHRVLIIGKGNSAFETADHLIGTTAMIHIASPNPLKFAWDTNFVGHLRAVNNNFLDTYHLKSQNAVLSARILDITKTGDTYKVRFNYLDPPDEIEEIEYDDIFNCAGFAFDASLWKKNCRPKLVIDDRFPKLSSDWQAVECPNTYFMGTLMQMRDFKKTMSAFIHGFRYNVATLYRILKFRYHNGDLDIKQYTYDLETILELILYRVNHRSAIWQQPGYICDFLKIDESGETATFYPELTLDFFTEHMVGKEDLYITISLDFGNDKRMPAKDRPRARRDDVAKAATSNFLHPIVRLYRGMTLLNEHHVIEDLFAEWREPEHILPLKGFLGMVISDPLQKETEMKQTSPKAC